MLLGQGWHAAHSPTTVELRIVAATPTDECDQSNQTGGGEAGSRSGQHAARQPMGTAQSVPEHQSAVEHRDAAAWPKRLQPVNFAVFVSNGGSGGGRTAVGIIRRATTANVATRVPQGTHDKRASICCLQCNHFTLTFASGRARRP